MADIGIIMGSRSDLEVMREAADVLKELKVEFELTVVSAHRTRTACGSMPCRHASAD